MRTNLICGRTVPARGEGVRAALKDRAEALSVKAPRLKPLHTLFSWHRLVKDDIELPFHARPLPPVRLADGTRPFVIDTALSADWYGGTLPLSGPTDPRASALWRECLESRPARARFCFSVPRSELVGDALLNLDLYVRNATLEAEVVIDYQVRESEPRGLRRFLTAMSLDRYTEPTQLEPPSNARPGQSQRLILPGLPAEPDLPALLADGLLRLGLAGEDSFESIDFIVMEYEEPYCLLRPRLNAVARGWNCEIPACYHQGFDPFLSPPEPPAGEEYRFPVAVYVKRGNWTDEPTIQVDVVHDQAGSYLEFLSVEGEKRLRHYAKLAEVELEMWNGPLADRWGVL